MEQEVKSEEQSPLKSKRYHECSLDKLVDLLFHNSEMELIRTPLTSVKQPMWHIALQIGRVAHVDLHFNN